MADLFVKSNLNPYKAVKFNISLKEFVDFNKKDGESRWYLEVGTLELDLEGNKIAPVYVGVLNVKYLDDIIDNIVSALCKKINWDDILEDTEAPNLYYFYPEGNNVSITSYIEFGIEDTMPASGLDFSEMVVTLNNGDFIFDVTDKFLLQGDPFNVKFKWQPERAHND